MAVLNLSFSGCPALAAERTSKRESPSVRSAGALREYRQRKRVQQSVRVPVGLAEVTCINVGVAPSAEERQIAFLAGHRHLDLVRSQGHFVERPTASVEFHHTLCVVYA